MSILEQEIIEKFQLLDKEAQQRVLSQLNDSTQDDFDFQGWLARVNELQAEVYATQGKDTSIDVVGILRDIREDED